MDKSVVGVKDLKIVVCDICFIQFLCSIVRSFPRIYLENKEPLRTVGNLPNGKELECAEKLISMISSLYSLGLLPVSFILDVLSQLPNMDFDSLEREESAGTVLWLFSARSIPFFADKLIKLFVPLVFGLGPCFMSEVVKFPFLVGTGEKSEMISSLEDSNANISFQLKVPDTFLKPFREEIDSRNEYKTQSENAIFNERERCFDEFCNLIGRFQQVNRSDLDGSKTSLFFVNDMIPRGESILNLHGSNLPWFSDMFVRLLLFHSLSNTQIPEQLINQRQSPQSNGQATEGEMIDKGKVLPTGGSYLSVASSGKMSTPPPTSTISNLNINVKHLSKLEERLGSGGIDYQQSKYLSRTNLPSNSSVNTTNNNRAKVPVLVSPSNTNYSPHSSGAFINTIGRTRNSNSNKNISSGSTGNPKNYLGKKEDFEEASLQFSGNQQFFFRFIVLLNSHRFNQHLLTALSSEISLLMEDNSFNNPAISLHFSAKKSAKPSNDEWESEYPYPGSDSFSPGGEVFRSESNIALSPESFTIKVKKLKILGKFLGLLHFYHLWSNQSGPATDATTSSPLSLYAKESAGLQSRQLIKSVLPMRSLLSRALRQGTLCITIPWMVEFLKMMVWSDQLRLTQFQPYEDIFHILASLQRHPSFRISLGSAKPRLSSNRLYCIVEIQEFLNYCKFTAKNQDGMESCRLEVDIRPTDDSLDSQDLSFHASFLRHVVPYIESYYLAIRHQNQRNENLRENRNQHRKQECIGQKAASENEESINRKATKKRQMPSKEAVNHKSDGILAQKTEESLAGTSAFGTNEYSITKIDFSTPVASMENHFQLQRSNSEVTLDLMSSAYTLSPTSVPQSSSRSPQSKLATDERTVPSRIAEINSNLLNASFVSESSADRETDNRDLSDRLENAFWTQHAQLHHMSQFLLSHSNQACLARIKQQVATSIQRFLKSIASLGTADAAATCMQNCYEELLCEGAAVLEEFYADLGVSLMPKLFGLYPMDARVVDQAVCFVQGQVDAQRQALSHHLRAYGLRKLKEAHELAVKQLCKRVAKNASSEAVGRKDSAIVAQEPNRHWIAEKEVAMKSSIKALLEFFEIVSANSEEQFTVVNITFTVKEEYFRLSLPSTSGDLAGKEFFARSRLSKLFSSLYIVACNIADWASACGFSMAAPIESAVNGLGRDALRLASENITHILGSLPSFLLAHWHRTREVHGEVAAGKTVIEITKFLTLSTPVILFLDALQMAVHDPCETSTDCKELQPRSFNFPSDLLVQLASSAVISEDSFFRILGTAGKKKNATAFESCRRLSGLAAAVGRGLVGVLSRYFQSVDRWKSSLASDFQGSKENLLKEKLSDDLFAAIEANIELLITPTELAYSSRFKIL